MQDLNGSSGLLLWLYLDKNANGYKLELSQKACEEWGLKKDSYYRAKKELESKGYLEQAGAGQYIFHEVRPGSMDAAAVEAGEAAESTADTFDGERIEARGSARGEKKIEHFAKSDIVSDGENENSQNQQRNNTDNTHTNNIENKRKKMETAAEAAAEALEVCGTIPAYIYEAILDPVTELQGGLVRLTNGKIYRVEGDKPFHIPKAQQRGER